MNDEFEFEHLLMIACCLISEILFFWYSVFLLPFLEGLYLGHFQKIFC
jgi:hypothetical protein